MRIRTKRSISIVLMVAMAFFLIPQQAIAGPYSYKSGNFDVVLQAKKIMLQDQGLKVMTMEWATDDLGTILSYSVGPDVMTVEVQCDTVVFAVNGKSTQIARSALDSDNISEDDKLALEVVSAAFIDSEGFDVAMLDFALAMSRFPAEAIPNSWLDCAACAATLVFYGLALSALITACGGPTAGWACVAAFIRLTGTKVTVLANCSRCVQG